jgi:carbonic anhydrase/acetyltransferase-like protein (isoleucine patch superfamily)
MAIYALGDKRPQFSGAHFVAENAAVIGDVVAGEGANVWFSATIRGDNDTITLGARVNIQDGAVLHTDAGVPLTLADDVSVGHMAVLHGCTIGAGALIGIGAIVLNRAAIGARSLIGAGALVGEGKEIPSGVLALGAPAKVVRTLTEEQQAYLGFIATHYVERAERYRESLVRIA